MFFFDFPAQTKSFLDQYWYIINYVLISGLFIIVYITFKRSVLGSAAIIFLFPTYLLRTKIFGVPSTYLEIAFILILATFLVKSILHHERIKNIPRSLMIPIIIFLASSTLSIFFSNNIYAALGLWKAYYVEPVLFFLLLLHTVKNKHDVQIIFLALGLSTIVLSLFAIFQQFTGFGIAQPIWLPSATRRVTSIFTSPNALGLYVGPIVVLYFGWMLKKLKDKTPATIVILAVFFINIISILFTKSQGTYLGVFAGIAFLVIFMLPRKWVMIIMTLGIIATLIIPTLRNALVTQVTFSDHAGQNRLDLWKGTTEYLFSSPKNFIFGSGIFGFPKVHEGFRDPKKIELLNYPHNFILNFWMETGLVGLFSMLWIIFNFFKAGSKSYKLQATGYKLILMAAMITILFHGLVDNPYFKNDLSMLFWTIIALMYI